MSRHALQMQNLRDRGFTLLELLLSISLIGLLISLFAPSLRQVREASQKVQSLANVRGHVTAMELYTADSRDMYLNMLRPEADYGIIRWNDYVQKIVYFQQVHYWHFSMARMYYGGNISHETFCVPGSSEKACARHSAGPNGYWYSASFLAAPEYWNRRTRQGRFQWRAVRAGEVLFPSQKGMFIGAWPMLMPSSAPDWRVGSEIGFVDGHADRVEPGRLLALDSGGDGQFFRMSIPILHTKDGVRGRDVK